MRFGFVAKLVVALTLLVLAIVLLKSTFNRQFTTKDPVIVGKQPLPTKDVIPAFSAMTDVKEKKRAFFNFIRPGIVNANRAIALDRQYLLDLKAGYSNDMQVPDRFEDILRRYKLSNDDFSLQTIEKLLHRVDVIPNELVMVQAANESGWGTSRFARLGLNFFGQWCFSKGCGLVPSARNEDANHEVKVFKSVDESIASYLNNLNTHPAYRHLRDVRGVLRQNNEAVTAAKLAPGLTSYSERGEEYVFELLQMLRHNKAYL
ncbi:MAG: glucosaminidase domain-containing protein [Psychrobium sp.]